jgi:hypothetical protein
LKLTAKERKSLGLLTFAVCASWALISFKVLIPFFMNSGQQKIFERYMTNGGLVSTADSISYWRIVVEQNVWRPETLRYLAMLFGPFAFFTARGSWWLLPALPGVAMNIISWHRPQTTLLYHYDWVILPFLVFALLQGVSKSGQVKTRASAIAWNRGWAAALLIAFCFSGVWPGRLISKFWPDRALIEDHFFLANLPSDRVTAANTRTLAHLNHISNLRWPGVFPDQRPEQSKPWPGDARLLCESSAQFYSPASPIQAFVLDTRDSLHVEFAGCLARSGWKMQGMSPGYSYWVSPRL